MWIPHYEQLFNVGLNPQITLALGNKIVVRAEHEIVAHPGLYQAHQGNAFSDSLAVRPRLQNFATKNPTYTRDVVNVPGG